MARRWSDLSDRSSRLIVAAAIAEAILKAAVVIDLKRRAGKPNSRLEAGMDRSGRCSSTLQGSGR